MGKIKWVFIIINHKAFTTTNNQSKDSIIISNQKVSITTNNRDFITTNNNNNQTDSIMTVSTMMDFITISHKRDSTTIKDSIMTSKTLTTPSSTRKTRTTGTKAQDANEPLKRLTVSAQWSTATSRRTLTQPMKHKD